MNYGCMSSWLQPGYNDYMVKFKHNLQIEIEQI